MKDLPPRFSASDRAAAQGGVRAGLLLAGSRNESQVPAPSGPDISGAAQTVNDAGPSVGPGASQAAGAADPQPCLGRNSQPRRLESTAPRATGLLTSFLPCDRATVESAVDAFLEQISGVGAGSSDLVDLGRLLPGIVAVAAATTATAVILKRHRPRKRKPSASSQAELDLLTCPSNLWKLGHL